MADAKKRKIAIRAFRSGFIDGLGGACNLYRPMNTSKKFMLARRARKSDWGAVKKDFSISLEKTGLIHYVHVIAAKEDGARVLVEQA